MQYFFSTQPYISTTLLNFQKNILIFISVRFQCALPIRHILVHMKEIYHSYGLYIFLFHVLFLNEIVLKKLSLRVIFLGPLDSPRLGKATVLQVICPRCLFARLLCVHFYATNICTGMGHPFLIPMSSIYPCINQVPL